MARVYCMHSFVERTQSSIREHAYAAEKNVLVPSKGLEPPHRCRYMDLNHARLPIPPRWQSELQCSGGPKGRRVRKTNTSILQPRQRLSNHQLHRENPKPGARKAEAPPYPSFAVIEIFAFSTFDTGQPFSAASAY